MPSRADLHVHSRYSDRPSEWYLDRIGAPESFTEPMELYRLCRARGMDFVTISDHDTIAGALDIAHLPGVFLSCEVTAAFPEDGCQVHVLVSGITPAQHDELQRRRRDLLSLVDYARREEIVTSLAHPLFSVNDRLTLSHVERLLLLFDRFELVNGTRDERGTDLFEAVLSSLTPALLEELADRHGIATCGDRPWAKWTVGGSDDHGGLYIATTWTETPRAPSVEEYLEHLRRGRHAPGGEPGSSLKLARSFQGLAHDYYRSRILNGGGRRDPLAELLRRLAAGEIERSGRMASGLERSLRVALDLAAGRSPSTRSGAGTSSGRFVEASAREAERRIFEGSCRLAQKAVADTLSALADGLPKGLGLAALPSLSSLSAAAVALSPYLAAFRFQHKDEPLLRAVANRFENARPLAAKSPRRAWFTDTLDEVNGVTRTLRTVAELAARAGRAVTVVTTSSEPTREAFELECFTPVAVLPLPRAAGMSLAIPPFLEVVEQCERQRYGEIVVSTPGPMGLTALAAGKLLGVPLTGVYHTDFPAYLRILGGDDRLESLTTAFMRWFYGQMDRVLVPSRAYLEELVGLGLARDSLAVLPRGVDTDLFSPARRDDRFFERYGRSPAALRLLYVGRISREKNLDSLLAAFVALRAEGLAAELVLVGDGPYLPELAARYERPDLLFTGFLHGEDLAAAYASCDLFVFPSETDTLGNVVLEAQASGLPVIVAGRGPRELVEDGESGLTLERATPAALADAIRSLAGDAEIRRRLGRQARAASLARSWNATLDALFPADRPKEPGTAHLTPISIGVRCTVPDSFQFSKSIRATSSQGM